MGTYRMFMPHLLMILGMLDLAIMFFILEASFKHGLSPHVFITYRNIIGGFFLFPFAYYLERNSRTKLTVSLLVELFLVSLLGLGLAPNMYFASLKYTSPTFASCIYNSVSSMTFVVALLLRVEVVDLRNPRGMAKIVGTLVSLAGVMTITIYKGPIVGNIGKPLFHFGKTTNIHENWSRGCVLAVLGCILFAAWFITMHHTLRRYPAPLSLASWMNLVGGAQSAVFTAVIEHKHVAWRIGLNIDLWSVLYGGVFISGLLVFINLYCTIEKGPVFVTMFNPVSTIFVAFLAIFVIGENVYTGSIVGGVLVIVGLYLLLWGKDGDQKVNVKPNISTIETLEDPNAAGIPK